MNTTIEKQVIFSLETRKLFVGVGLVLAVFFTLIAWSIVPNNSVSGTDIVGRTIVPYIYTQGQGKSLFQQCYQIEKRFGRILTAETSCK